MGIDSFLKDLASFRLNFALFAHKKQYKPIYLLKG